MNCTSGHIVGYYDILELDYRFGWNLGQNLAMHFGYWDETTRSFTQSLERENAVLAERVGIGPGDRVLDAGCGLGGSAIYLARRFGCRVTGITLSQKQADSALRHAERNGVGHLADFRKLDYLATAFADETFDVAWAIESVCHATDKRAFLNEMQRVLRPGGRLVVADGFATRADYNPREGALMTRWLRGWCVEFLETRDNFLRFLGEAGFVEVAFTDATAHILPSSRRLHVYSAPFLPVAAVARFLGRGLRTRALNVVAAHHQYRALKQGLWVYGIVSARRR
jgi:tocopherol O-methyltransferase